MTAPAARPPEHIDLVELDAYEQGGPPYDRFLKARHEQPVMWHPWRDEGFWAITRYKDIEHISLTWKDFSAARKGVIFREWVEEEAMIVRDFLINQDPPKHSKFRKLVQAHFTIKALKYLEDHIRDMAGRIVDNIAQRGSCDFVTDVAAELPLQVIVEMLGVPMEDRHKVFDWSNKMIGFDDPEYQVHENMTGQIAAAEMFMYAHELANQRLAEPREDLISRLLHAEVDGERLTPVEFTSFFVLLAVAGNETTRNLIAGGMLALMQHPEQRARLVADPSLIPSGVEEMLRWVTPVNLFRRTATHDMDLGGQRIREGDSVLLFYASANRDETLFPNPNVFDVGRTPNEHLAFGFGTHFCLGAHLARLEITIMFQELLRRLPDMELAGPPRRLRSYFINGIKSLPVRFTPERA